MGTGTGILARIARARGAQFVVGTDIDPDALSCAGAHTALDSLAGVGPNCAPGAEVNGAAGVALGSAADALSDGRRIEIHLSAAAPDYWGARFDLVVANILEAPLCALAGSLSRALAPGGILLISGFTRPQVPALRVLYERAGLTLRSRSSLDEWVLLMFSSP